MKWTDWVEPEFDRSEDATFLSLKRMPFESVKWRIKALHGVVDHIEESRARIFRENEAEHKIWRVLRFIGYRPVFREQLLEYSAPISGILETSLAGYGWSLDDYAKHVYHTHLKAHPPINPFDLDFFTFSVAIVGIVVGLCGMLYSVGAGTFGTSVFFAVLASFAFVIAKTNYPRHV